MVVALSGQHTGLMARIDLPLWMEFIGCLILLDFSLYWQHRLFHRLPFFWAFHSAHHGDRTLNVSSALRFHPGAFRSSHKADTLVEVFVDGVIIGT